MNHRPIRAVLFVLGLAAAGALPILGRALRSGGEDRCAFDGVAVVPGSRVEVVDGADRRRPFCCVDCARAWLARDGRPPRSVLVRDEPTGRELPAGKAWFVESRVPAGGAGGSSIHVFAGEAEARRHAAAFRGVVLEGGKRPFPLEEGASR